MESQRPSPNSVFFVGRPLFFSHSRALTWHFWRNPKILQTMTLSEHGILYYRIRRFVSFCTCHTRSYDLGASNFLGRPGEGIRATRSLMAN